MCVRVHRRMFICILNALVLNALKMSINPHGFKAALNKNCLRVIENDIVRLIR